jgi:hypothetical protein
MLQVPVLEDVKIKKRCAYKSTLYKYGLYRFKVRLLVVRTFVE